MSTTFFDRMYAEATPYTGTDADLLAIVAGPGAIWYERSGQRAILATSIAQFRVDGERVQGLARAGDIARDRVPLDAGVDIYTSPRKAAL